MRPLTDCSGESPLIDDIYNSPVGTNPPMPRSPSHASMHAYSLASLSGATSGSPVVLPLQDAMKELAPLDETTMTLKQWKCEIRRDHKSEKKNIADLELAKNPPKVKLLLKQREICMAQKELAKKKAEQSTKNKATQLLEAHRKRKEQSEQMQDLRMKKMTCPMFGESM